METNSPVSYATSLRSVPWISAAIPSRERRRGSREDAVTILSLIFALSGDLTMSRRYRNVGKNGENQMETIKMKMCFTSAIGTNFVRARSSFLLSNERTTGKR